MVSAGQMSDLLQVRNLTKSFGGVVANKEVSLSVPSGAIVGLIGPNGSGKTTLFNCIVGYQPVDRGSITFAGREVSRLRVPEIARLGLIRTFQQTRIYRNMSCMQNMQISVRHESEGLRTMFSKFVSEVNAQADALLEFVGLYDRSLLPAGELSFGQQKLLELAMALMNRPKMLLLDEPTAGVNPTLINGLIDRLQRANSEFGITLLVIEHNMRAIMHLAQHIYCLAHGELLASGSPQAIQNDRRVVDAYLAVQ
jgi:ABC-type branched-subunit amino acid transport system ATPase component